MKPELPRRKHFLMCQPDHFDVTYSINPWMHPDQPTSRERAMHQWDVLHDLYLELGHKIDVLPSVPGLPDMVFSANGAVVDGDKALVARFRYGQRMQESAAYLTWFASLGLTEVRQATAVNEGEGDFLLAGEEFLAGVGFRTEGAAHDEMQEFFGRKVVSLHLVDPRFYHLDTALAVLSDEQIMYFPAAFGPESQEVLRDRFPDAIVADEADALVFGLNVVSDGLHVVLPQQAEGLNHQLRERGYEPIGVDVSELNKAGGGVKCCTLELHGTSAD